MTEAAQQMLKPCPFCGGLDLEINSSEHFIEVGFCQNHYKKEARYQVECICGCAKQRYYETEERAIKEWNTRPHEDAPIADAGEAAKAFLQCIDEIIGHAENIHQYRDDMALFQSGGEIIRSTLAIKDVRKRIYGLAKAVIAEQKKSDYSGALKDIDYLLSLPRPDYEAVFANHGETIRTALANNSIPAWQPIETAPRDGRKFCGYSPTLGVRSGVSFNERRQDFDIGFSSLIRDWTHWMPEPPLPAAPQLREDR